MGEEGGLKCSISAITRDSRSLDLAALPGPAPRVTRSIVDRRVGKLDLGNFSFAKGAFGEGSYSTGGLGVTLPMGTLSE